MSKMASTLDGEIPNDVRHQKEEATKLLEDFEQGGEQVPGESYGTSSRESIAPPSPGSMEDLKRQVEDLTQVITQLQAASADENNETWRHRFSVLEGKYKAELPRAAERIRQLEDEITRLQEELGRKAQIPLSAEEREIADEIGVDETIIGRMKKIFRTQAEPAAEPATSSAAQTAYLALLDIKARGWREAVNSEGFDLFLKKNPAAYDALIAADKQRNAEGTAAVYNTYFQTSGRRGGRESAGSSSKGGSFFSGENPQSWSMEQIQEFENDVAQGRIKMGSEKYKKLKASRDEYLATLGM